MMQNDNCKCKRLQNQGSVAYGKRRESVNVIELNNICKAFGDNQANQNVCFDLKKGEIHALLGENGAGKSTLMNVLYGLYSCDAGDIVINGDLVEVENPRKAIEHG